MATHRHYIKEDLKQEDDKKEDTNLFLKPSSLTVLTQYYIKITKAKLTIYTTYIQPHI